MLFILTTALFSLFSSQLWDATCTFSDHLISVMGLEKNNVNIYMTKETTTVDFWSLLKAVLSCQSIHVERPVLLHKVSIQANHLTLKDGWLLTKDLLPSNTSLRAYTCKCIKNAADCTLSCHVLWSSYFSWYDERKLHGTSLMYVYSSIYFNLLRLVI